MPRGRVYNRIFNQTDWDLVSKENKSIVTDFILEYTQRKMKKSTVDQYSNDLRIVLIYILKNCDNRPLFELTKKDFRNFSLWLSSTMNMSNARVNRMMSSVRSLLTYCEDDDEYEYEMNTASKVKGLPKEAVRTNEDDYFLSYEQVVRLKEELLSRGMIQTALLLMMLFDTGARRNEIFQIKKKGLLDGNKTNPVVGKRGKIFPLIYMNDTKELVREFLEIRGKDDIDSLWVQDIGKETIRPATYAWIYEQAKVMSKILSDMEGREINFFPHSLRHTRAESMGQGTDTRILDANGNPKKFSLEEIQVFLHHSDTNTTKGYMKNHDEDLINEMFNM